MEQEKLLNKIYIIQEHQNVMSSIQIEEWFSTLKTLDDVMVEDLTAPTPVRCKQRCEKCMFILHFNNVAKMYFTLTRVDYESDKYYVTSVTEYNNDNEQVKEPNKQIEQHIEKIKQFNKHYPIDYDLTPPHTWRATCTNYIKDIKENLALAKIGYRKAETRLCNILGTIKRSVNHDDLTVGLLRAIEEAVAWLQSVGRRIDFTHPDPAMWITDRKGDPRF
jgi:hypothetical protein